jgi:hypothetical protein
MDYTLLKNICLFAGLISILFTASACTKGEISELSEIPKIELQSISSNLITEFEDELIITISYEDGNGDIGFEETDQFALFVRDLRLQEFDEFYLGPIAPPDSNVPIQGELDIEFPNLFIFGNGETETTRFEIMLIDRAMNESNILTTDDVTIKK